MFRPILIASALSLANGTLIAGTLIAGTLPAVAQEAPRLRADITVDGPLVTLGDLLANAGAAAGIAVFRAPDPGTSGTVRADRILAAAAANGVTGVDAAGIGSVAVSRSGRSIDRDEITAAVAARLVATGNAYRVEDVEVTLDGFGSPISIESATTEPLSIRDFQYDGRNGRFAVVLTVEDSAMLADGVRLTGRAVEIVDVPVLARPMDRGETISPRDVTLTRLPRSALRQGTVTETADLVGKSARRRLTAGQSLSADALMEPILVGRNEMVTIVFQVPGLTLTARGRALSAGANGEIVKVFNLQSGRTVEAEVTGPGTVAVMPQRVPYASLSTTVR